MRLREARTTVVRRDSYAHIKSEPMLNPHKIISLLAVLLILTPGAAFAQDDDEAAAEEEAPKAEAKTKKKVAKVDDADDGDIDEQEALAAGQPLAAASNKIWNVGATLSTRIGQGTFVRLENQDALDAEFGGDSSNAYDRVSASLSLSGSLVLFKQFIATANMSATQWVTEGGGTTYPNELRISDASIDIFWFGKTFEKTRTNLSVDVGANFPTSRFSRAASVIVDPFAVFILRQPLLGKMFFVGSLVTGKTFHRFTSPTADLNKRDDGNPLFRANGAEDLGDGIVAIGGRNTEYFLAPTVGFNFIVLPKMTASVRYRYARFWSYEGLIPEECAADEFCNPNASGGRGVGDQVSGSIGVNYQLSKNFFLGGGISSAQRPKTSDNASFRFPFWNFEGAAANSSAINARLTFNY